MSNQILGDSREVFDGYAGTQGVLDTNELYKRSRQGKSFTNSGFKYLGTQNVEGTQSGVQFTATDKNDILGNPGHAEPENYITHLGILRRLRHTTTTTVNLVLSCNNESNASINDTDNHYAHTRIHSQANSTTVTRDSNDSSQYYSTWTPTVFTSANADHTGAGTWWIANIGRQFRNVSVYGEFVFFTTILYVSMGAFNFDHVDDNADDVPAYLNFNPYTGNLAYKNLDYYGIQEPHSIIMD